ncbi:hydroxypyruvate isomerase family protein [Crateriforma conspicua]|uniref:Hydroxypyruvate isomerase n=1 Tax=Crateriforma conspicua TaxID=2527996 RepID=A0A5C6FPM9_9PLAN|nr:TIM barrel protein [Crateriforma conspicua]TWU64879.1 Hydroxypyruvate isomerase [Crateriforma conspicua]
MMKRREFLQVAAAASAGVVTTTPSVRASESVTRFRMAFAPHFGMFTSSAGDDLVDQLKFAADQGFTAWEDNLMRDRSVADQERVAAAMQQLEMKMGVISALRGIKKAVSFAGDNAGERDIIVQALRDVVPVAKRVNATHMTVVCGLADPKLPRDYQTANAIDLLKRCCDVVEPHGLVMVLEPLNSKKNHPGMFLSESPHAYQICKAVGRPSCKILFDIYHQQITEGNLIPNIERCWDEIGYFQCGDNPGRKEPGTGEIHYGNVFQHLADAGYDGIVGMEHGNSKPGVEGEQAVIDAYRSVDPA